MYPVFCITKLSFKGDQTVDQESQMASTLRYKVITFPVTDPEK
jgi:hypothetical protein